MYVCIWYIVKYKRIIRGWLSSISMTSKTISAHGPMFLSLTLTWLPSSRSFHLSSDLPVDCSIPTFHYISSISLLHLFPTHSSPIRLFSTLLIAKVLHLSPPLPSQSPGNDPQLDLFYLLPLHQKGFQGSFLRNMPRTRLSLPAMLLTPSTIGGTSFHIRFTPLFLLASAHVVFRQHKREHTLFLCLSALARNKYML